MDDGLSWYKRKYNSGKISRDLSGTNMTSKGCVLVPKRQVVDFDYRIFRAMKYRKLHDFGYVVDICSSGSTDIDSVWHEFVSDYLGCLEGKTHKVDVVTGQSVNDRCYAMNNLSHNKFPQGWKRELAVNLYIDESSKARIRKQRLLSSDHVIEILRQVEKDAAALIETAERESAMALVGKRQK
jgi:hypothetical protein